MKKDSRYMVFRLKDDGSPPTFWGWTRSKAVITVFKRQRNMHKYKVVMMDDEEIGERFSDNTMNFETMIEYIKLGDVVSGDMVSFFTTANEFRNAEIKIQKLLEDQASLERIGAEYIDAVNLIMNLSDACMEVLEYIGYKPKELKILFPEVDGYYNEPEDQIEWAYGGRSAAPEEEYKHDPSVPGMKTLQDTANKVIYSIQSVVRVLRDDL